MAVSARASRALHQALGDDAGEDVVNWMSEMEINGTRTHDRIESLFNHVTFSVDACRADLRAEIKAAEAAAERRYNDLLKWSFVFWIGAVGAIAALAGVLR